MRAALECPAVRIAIPNMMQRDLDHMEEILGAYSALDSLGKWAEYNRRFHLALSASANNRTPRRLIEECRLGIYRYADENRAKRHTAKSTNHLTFLRYSVLKTQ